MAFTYDVNTEIGKVRLLITDTNEDNPIFQDAEINTFISMTAVDGVSDLLKASAQALETIARSEVLVLKVIDLLDLKTDGAKVAEELRESAKLLREQSDEQAGFDVIEWGLTPSNRRNILWNDMLRNQ